MLSEANISIHFSWAKIDPALLHFAQNDIIKDSNFQTDPPTHPRKLIEDRAAAEPVLVIDPLL